MQPTKNFALSEFACHDGTEVPGRLVPNCKALAQRLQIIRDHIGKPIKILSGYRTPAYNASVGGAEHSQHKEAKAAGITVDGMTPRELHAEIEALIAAKRIPNGGLGLYKGFVHVDTGNPRRWNG